VYGTEAEDADFITLAIKQADLYDVLERLPDGLQTQLGEGGALLAGGEGQRVRLGRAIYREGVRLVILDEAFRGLDRSKRHELLARAREGWQEATLLFVSHDVGQTQEFERVLVIEEGKLVEDDAPSTLRQKPNSRYRALLEAEEEVQQEIWGSAEWRRLWLEKGRLSEKERVHSTHQA
jgi:ATP-binding cassette subfamily B protein